MYLLFDGISDIKEDVEIDGHGELIDGYCLSVDIMHKKWRIKDTGSKGVKMFCKRVHIQMDFMKV